MFLPRCACLYHICESTHTHTHIGTVSLLLRHTCLLLSAASTGPMHSDCGSSDGATCQVRCIHAPPPPCVWGSYPAHTFAAMLCARLCQPHVHDTPLKIKCDATHDVYVLCRAVLCCAVLWHHWKVCKTVYLQKAPLYDYLSWFFFSCWFFLLLFCCPGCKCAMVHIASRI